MGGFIKIYTPAEVEAARKMFARTQEMLLRAPHLNLDLMISGLMPRRSVKITRLTVIDEYDVVRLEYEVVPIDELPTRENAKESRALGPHWWILSGRDDVGTTYEDLGGAYGLPEDGLLADGERDLRPAPPASATWLDIAFRVPGEPETFEKARYVLRLPLPIRTSVPE